MLPKLLKAGLLKDIIQRPWGNINVGLAGDSNCPGLGGMLKLSVAAAHVHLPPTVLEQEIDEGPDFHGIGGWKLSEEDL